MSAVDFDRRFSGVRRLYGVDGLAQLQTAHVCVLGVGGVGSWAAEALARNAVAKITLIDLDHIAESNMNRQIHALETSLGQAKVRAMAHRIHLINPDCQVHEVEEFVTPENVQVLLDQEYDFVLDAMDDVKAKIAVINYCSARNLPLVITGAAGGRLDPSQIKITDLAHVTGDRLLAKVRNQLRRDHAFPQGRDKKRSPKFSIPAVYSAESIIKPEQRCTTEGSEAITGLNCAGYGSSVCVTASFGFVAASWVLQKITEIGP